MPSRPMHKDRLNDYDFVPPTVARLLGTSSLDHVMVGVKQVSRDIVYSELRRSVTSWKHNHPDKKRTTPRIRSQAVSSLPAIYLPFTWLHDLR